ncbi:MAG: nucleotidyltransferase domain-containing protein [Candidatus Diapherotrites archaeon]
MARTPDLLFGSATRVRLLELLLFNAGAQLHLREIARRAKAVPTFAKKELGRLEACGLVKRAEQGNMLLYSANEKSPLYNDMRSLLLKTSLLPEQLKKILQKFDVKFALIYGSFAAGTESRGSDVDMLIVGNVREREFIAPLHELEGRLGREVNYIIWTEHEFNKRAGEGNGLLVNIARNPVIFLAGDEDEFGRIAGKRPGKKGG